MPGMTRTGSKTNFLLPFPFNADRSREEEVAYDDDDKYEKVDVDEEDMDDDTDEEFDAETEMAGPPRGSDVTLAAGGFELDVDGFRPALATTLKAERSNLVKIG